MAKVDLGLKLPTEKKQPEKAEIKFVTEESLPRKIQLSIEENNNYLVDSKDFLRSL